MIILDNSFLKIQMYDRLVTLLPGRFQLLLMQAFQYN